MNELFASIKAFIEKGNIIIFLLSIAAAIFTYQVLAKEILWAIFAFCLAYAIFYGFQNLYNNYKFENKKQEAEKIKKQNEEALLQRQKEDSLARMRTIYDSFPEQIKEALLLLYNMPQVEGGYINSRILKMDNSEEAVKLRNLLFQLRINGSSMDLLDCQKSIESDIITMTPDFYSIIEEKAKKKEEE